MNIVAIAMNIFVIINIINDEHIHHNHEAPSAGNVTKLNMTTYIMTPLRNNPEYITLVIYYIIKQTIKI